MTEFIKTLCDPDVPFLRYAFFSGMLAAVAFGVMGTYVVVRRISYLAGAIAHCVLGGIGVALYFQTVYDLPWCTPMAGAVVSALIGAMVIGLVSRPRRGAPYARQREDTAIGALWAIGMAVGLLFLAKTPGYVDPMSYLFGNILMISKQDLWLIGGLDVLILVMGTFFYHKFLAVCFDEEFAALRGVRVEAYYLLLLCLTALTVVLLVSVVGIVMVIALLTLPAAMASHFSRRLWQMMILSVLLCMAFTAGGLGISYSYNLPTGPTIIVFTGAGYLVLAASTQLRRGTDRE